MKLMSNILDDVAFLIKDKSGNEISGKDLMINATRKEFEGDFTLLVFPLIRYFKRSPEDTAALIGDYLVSENKLVKSYNVIKGFLNLEMEESFWNQGLESIHQDPKFGRAESKNQKVLVEYSSPNTNKPLHLGHIRNILLGWSVSSILEAAGYEVVRTQVINDRGIAVCKSMLAWQKFGQGETPESSGIKGDHLVGKYYVEFDQKFREEYLKWQESEKALAVFQQAEGDDKEAFFSKFKNDYFNQYSAIGAEAREMLLKWEAGDSETVELWKKMNGWVYAGFELTYKNMGVHFDCNYYESETFKLGKNIVEEGLAKDKFYQEQDNSIWADLTDAKMDKKILLRSDGTALYITQDLGTAELRFGDHQATKMVYVVGDEQDYHFKVLFELLKRLERPYAEGLYHLSYGMVDLPSGRMKSREGKVVDADDLMEEVFEVARNSAVQRAEEMEREMVATEAELRRISMAALKFFIIKVHPQKRMVFNPEESLDMQGQTGPYVQNAFVRIQSIFRKMNIQPDQIEDYGTININNFEKDLISSLFEFPDVIEQAAIEYQPSSLANYCYDLAKKLHKFYAEVKINSEEDEDLRNFRLKLIGNVAKVLKEGMGLLGIEMVDKM